MGPLLAGPSVSLSPWELWACANTVLKTHGDKAPHHVAEQIVRMHRSFLGAANKPAARDSIKA